MDDMRIYVACLASYNNGVLHGEWLDVTSDEDELWEGIKRVLRTSPYPNVEVDCPECEGSGLGSWVASAVSDERRPCAVCEGRGKVPSAEEWAVHDYDGVPSDFGEYPSVEKLCQYAGLFEELESYEDEGAFRAYLDQVHGNDLDSAVEDFRERYQGHHASFQDFAEEYAEAVGLLSDVPDNIRCYFDYERFARDLAHDYTVVEGTSPVYGVYVFNDRY